MSEAAGAVSAVSDSAGTAISVAEASEAAAEDDESDVFAAGVSKESEAELSVGADTVVVVVESDVVVVVEVPASPDVFVVGVAGADTTVFEEDEGLVEFIPSEAYTYGTEDIGEVLTSDNEKAAKAAARESKAVFLHMCSIRLLFIPAFEAGFLINKSFLIYHMLMLGSMGFSYKVVTAKQSSLLL